MTDFRINVIVDPRRAKQGTREVERSLKRIDTQANSLRQTLLRTFAVLGGLALVRQLVRIADSFTLLQNRIGVVTDSQAELGAVTDRVFEIANNTRTSFQATAEVYVRTALAAKTLGRSQEELLQFTESVNKAIILSGASARESGAGLIQLSQGIASNRLSGDELRSVLEQLPVVADVIAKSLGVTRGELRRLGEDGKIGAITILDAFKEAREEIAERFAKTIPTVAQSFTILKNNVAQFVGELNKAQGITRAFGLSIVGLADNIEQLARSVLFLTVALGTGLVVRGINIAIAALGRLRIALLKNPLTALPTLITLAIAAFIAFGDQIGIGGGALASLQDVAVATFDVIGEAIALVVDGVGVLFQVLLPNLQSEFEFSLRGVVSAAASAADAIGGVFRGTLRAIIATWNNLPRVFSSIGELAFKAVRDAAENTIDFVAAAFQTIGDVITRVSVNIKNLIADTASAIGAAAVGNVESVRTFEDNIKSSIMQIENEFTGLGKSFAGNLAELAKTDLLPTVQLSEEAKETGTIIADAFFEGFSETTGAQDLVEEIFDRAEDRARTRIAQTAADVGEDVDLTTTPEATAVNARANAAFDKLFDNLRSEAKLLQLSSAEREIGNQLRKAEQRLIKEGSTGELRDTQLARLETQIRTNQFLKDQASLLKEIRGPLDDLARRQDALTALQEKGIVTAEEFAKKLLEIELEIPGIARANAEFNELFENLKQEADLLKLSSSEREIGNQLRDAEQQLIKAGASDEQLARQLQEIDAQIRANQLLEDQANLLQEIRGPFDDLARRQAALNALQLEGALSAEEYATALRELELDAANLGNTFEDGLVRGFEAIRQSIGTVADQVENTLVGAFNSAEEALVSFVTTGEVDFARLVNSILADVTRLLVSQALQALTDLGSSGSGGTGGGSGFLGLAVSLLGSFAGGAQDGANAQAGQSFVVGEQGPELFVAPTAGRIVPNAEVGAMQQQPSIITTPPANVNVQVVNVTSMDDVFGALETPEGEQRVLTIINNNRNTIKSTLA